MSQTHVCNSTPLLSVLLPTALLTTFAFVTDSGVDDNLIDSSLGSQDGIPTEEESLPKDIHVLDCKLQAQVTHPLFLSPC